MSRYLIPIKTGNEQFPVSYRNYLPAIVDKGSIASTIEHRTLYIGSVVKTTGSTQWILRIDVVSLLTWEHRHVGDIQFIEIGSRQIGSILVDDTMIYVSSMNQATIYVFDIETLAFKYSAQYSTSSMQAYGKMQWFDEQTICFAYGAGFVFFDTVKQQFTYKPHTTQYDVIDISVGKHAIMSNRNVATADSVIMYHIDTETFSTLSLTSNAVAVSCYENGKFYIANPAYLYIIDEATQTIEKTIVTSWSAPHTINVTNGTVFVTCVNSDRLYVYDTNSNTSLYVILPWTFPNWSSGYSYVNAAQQGSFFLPFNTLLQLSYSGQSKYNFGPKSSNMSIMFNTSTEPKFTYDNRFITFHDSYVSIHNGVIQKPFETYDDTMHMKSVHISKSEYNHIIRLVMKKS